MEDGALCVTPGTSGIMRILQWCAINLIYPCQVSQLDGQPYNMFYCAMLLNRC